MAVLGSLALLCTSATAAHASPTQDAQFQDDNHLLYAPADQVAKTLDTIQGLGVDRLRVSVFWKGVAPDPLSQDKPAGFDATDPASYPAGSFDRYDMLLRLAAQRHLTVNFDVTSPAPLWATGTSPDRPDIENTYDPDADAYRDFFTALGKRYSGTYVPPGQQAALPRVDYWSVWNEPNQPGWLTPQWAADPRNPKAFIEASPQIYRRLVDSAYSALTATGHASDTILVGETAPKGVRPKGETRAIAALRFLRQLYCVDDNLQFLQGSSAQLRGCPVSNQAATFAAQHPGLFKMTGYSHHPYELTFAPNVAPKSADAATIANLGQLEKQLKRVFQRYGQPIPGKAKNVPLYLTEFGYQTDPPDPTAVSPAKQAAYINQAEYITWRDRSVKTLTQFLLFDDAPVEGAKGPARYLTFQSGLQFLSGKKKPAFGAYAMPIFIPQRKVTRGKRFLVWGGARLASPGKKALVAVQAKAPKSKKYTTLAMARTDGRRGYLTSRVRLKRTSLVRLRWISPAGTAHASRAVSVTVR